MKRNTIVNLASVMAAFVGIALALTIQTATTPPMPAAFCQKQPVLSYLPEALTYDANHTRSGSLTFSASPSPNYPIQDWSFIQGEMLRLYDVRLTIQNGTNHSDFLVQHEKYPYHGRAGEWIPPLAHGYGIPSILVTWNETQSGVPLERVILHEVGHALGLDHHNAEGNIMFESGLTALGARGTDTCQAILLRHIHRSV